MIDRACISINSICDLNCKYCYFYERNVINTKCISSFTKNEVINILQNISEYSELNNINFKIGLVGSGEPLLSVNLIEEVLQWIDDNPAARERIKLYTISNGYAVKISTLEMLYKFKHLIDLSISLDGYKELHNYARVKKVNGEFIGTYDKVFKTICEHERIFGYKPSINITVHKQTIKNKDNLITYLIDNDFKNVTFSRLVDCEFEDLKITNDEFNEFIEWIESLNLQHKINVRNISVKGKKVDCSMYGAKCGVGQTNIFFSDKKVYPCGRFIGNSKYELSEYKDRISNIEKSFSKLVPLTCEEGCYYDKFVKKVDKV